MASITVPFGYLLDARTAAVREVRDDANALSNAESESLISNATILDRSIRLYGELFAKDSDVKLKAASDGTSSPISHMLDEMLRVVAARLDECSSYGPPPMRDVLDVADELRWIATEAIRLADDADWRMARNLPTTTKDA